MRRLLLAVFVFIVFGIVLSLVFRNHQGYLLLSFNGWQIETSLLFALAALLVGIWVLAVIWRILVAVVTTPSSVRGFFSRRKTRKARRSLYSGLEHMAEGRWSTAESELKRLADVHDAPGLNYLYAARAAQFQGHVRERDRYLEKAASSRGSSELAVLLTQAELQRMAGQTAEASATLTRLYEMEPRHPLVLRMSAEQAMENGDYKQLRKLLDSLHKHSKMDAERIEEMAIAAWTDELSQHRDVGQLTGAWRKVPKRLRNNPAVAKHYAECLKSIHEENEAANVIRNVLKQQWDPQLVLLFGDLRSDHRTDQLATVEGWLKQYGEKPELLLVAGRLCLRSQLWGRARSYFEAGQKNQSRPDALLELGHLFEQINDKEEARQAYRKGLEIRVADSQQLVGRVEGPSAPVSAAARV
ncbi:MAG: hypothetical protein PF501_14435 [Salinisphaera sp.]|jgi:HemY protein|nr:hypothetical protein [Salinisphaera sp.]